MAPRGFVGARRPGPATAARLVQVERQKVGVFDDRDGVLNPRRNPQRARRRHDRLWRFARTGRAASGRLRCGVSGPIEAFVQQARRGAAIG